MVGTKQRTVHKAKTRSEYILRESMLMGANSTKIEGAGKVSNLGVQKHESQSELQPGELCLRESGVLH